MIDAMLAIYILQLLAIVLVGIASGLRRFLGRIEA
jgi:hypothetical protein